jgi:hypothetical protein
MRKYYYRAKPTTLDTVLEHFELRDESRVIQYLRQYPFLASLILEAKSQIARFFRPETRIAIEVSADPSDGSSQLFLLVLTRLNANEAYDLFERLDQEWWLEASERAQFRMNIVPEFI